MTERDAAEILSDSDVFPIIEGAMTRVKEIMAMCLEADIPVAGARPDHGGKS